MKPEDGAKEGGAVGRRTVLIGGAAAGFSVSVPGMAFGATGRSRFPKGFLWGAATSGHQVEGNDVSSDAWLLEHVRPTMFVEPAGDAADSFHRWREDIELVRRFGLTAYRFSIEWSRIEPERGAWSQAMVDHYGRVIAACRELGLSPVVTFSHFALPRWFAAAGGWTNPDAPELFAGFCDRAARSIASGIGFAVTLNEPQLFLYLDTILPPPVMTGVRAMLAGAARATASARFSTSVHIVPEDHEVATSLLIKAHRSARAALKAVRSDLPVGVSLAVSDDQAVGDPGVRDAMRRKHYGAWFDAVKGDDFLGVQNYARDLWSASGHAQPPADAIRDDDGREVYPASLGNAVRYAHRETGVPILVTEHGINTARDERRQAFIPEALRSLKAEIDGGVPVLGYIHWSLLDNYEWASAYRAHYGLVAVDRMTFRRSPKPSFETLGRIARRNDLA